MRDNSIKILLIGSCLTMIVQITGKAVAFYKASNFLTEQEGIKNTLEEKLSVLAEKERFVDEVGYWDRISRQKFGLGFENDKIIILPEDAKISKPFFETPTEGQTNNWKRWWGLVWY